MGMAASQARFLGLTARMNNVEYEGQQINQQRTALSNKTASYYTDLLGMAVPTAPSVEEFTQTIYSFDDGALTNQITSLIADSDNKGTYKVSYIRTWTDDFSVVSAAPSIITKTQPSYTISTAEEMAAKFEEIQPLLGKEGTTYALADGTPLYYKDGELYKDEACSADKKYAIATDGALTITGAQGFRIGATDLRKLGEAPAAGTDPYYESLSTQQREALLEEEEAYLNLLHTQHSNNDDYFVRYVQNTSTGEYEAVFYNKNVVENAIYNSADTHNSQSFIGAYKVGSAERVEEIKGKAGCYLEQDSTGRYINITIDDKKYALTTNTVTDQRAYEDAMNQYEYDKAIYDKNIDEINAKIEIIQAEDKNLELRLKQLDTEHNAISNEKDAVSKVIEKSVESGFKTFG